MVPNVKLPEMLKSLSTDSLATVRDLAWLRESWRNPIVFWRKLKKLQDAMLAWPAKSIPFEQYDFYHDIIVRNQKSTAPALRWHDPLKGWQEVSYFDLGKLAARKEHLWRQRGVAPGQTVCIILPLGSEYVVSLLAALKIGLIVSSLPPQGTLFLQKRVQALEPDWISTEKAYTGLLPGLQEKMLPENSGADIGRTDSKNSHAYTSNALVAQSFDPSADPPHIPKELTADAAYLCSLRDGMLCLGIQPADVVAAPGMHFLESQPALLLAVLLNGGTFLHLEPKDISKNPLLLGEQVIHVIGISSQVRDHLLKQKTALKTPWKFWFRNPAETVDTGPWQVFIKSMDLKKTYCGNIKIEAAGGGASLFSVRRRGWVHVNVLPSAGVPWMLADTADGSSEAVGDFGLFAQLPFPETQAGPRCTTNLMAKTGSEWLFAGTRLSGRAGRAYPGDEVMAAIRRLRYGKNCVLIETPPSGSEGQPAFVLLIFTGRMAAEKETVLATKVTQYIERNLGAEFIPDRIRYIPLSPRTDSEGNVDRKWCAEQFLSGRLYRKSQNEVFQCLSLLRESLNQSL